MVFFCFVFLICLRKQGDIWIHHHWFPCEMATRLCVEQEINFASTNQMHYLNLGNDTSSVWNFYSHSSDQCHFTGKSVMDCHERSWQCSYAVFLSSLVVHCTLHTHSYNCIIQLWLFGINWLVLSISTRSTGPFISEAQAGKMLILDDQN